MRAMKTLSFPILIIQALVGSALAGPPASVVPEPSKLKKFMPRLHEEKLAEAKQKAGAIELVMVGDSITHAWSRQPGSFLDEAKLLNLGFPGDRTQNVLWRFQHGALDGISPRLVTLMIGTNHMHEAKKGYLPDSPQDIFTGIRAVVAEVRERLPEARLVIFSVFPRGPEAAQQRVEAVNAMLPQLADGERVFHVDLKAIGYGLGPLADLLASKLIVGHNLRFDACWLRVKCGLRLSRLFCTLTAARLLAAGTRAGNNLDQCLERYCGIAPAPDQSRSDWGNSLLTQDQIAYAARDVAHLHLLKGCLDRDLEMTGLDGVFALERRLLPVVIDMEVAGMPVDADKMHMLEVTWRDQSAAIAAEVRSDLGKPDLNIGSAKQLLAALKDRGIEVSSTNEETLQSCGDRGIVPKILAYRGLEKRAQQAASLIEAMAGDGRIHGQFDPMGTATGRFSSKSPNLQNIGRGELRSCFAAGPGRVMVIADYSQIELRAAAAIAGEKKMIEAYARGDDLHKLTASAVLGKPLQDVTKEDRQLAKAVNFGLLYGQSAKGLARYAKTAYGVTITEEEARMMRRKFFDTYGSLRQWHGLSRVSAEKGVQEIRTISGRRRLIPPSATEWERFTALVNTPVQGGCADGLKQALIDLSAALPDGAKIISTVHDEIIVECSQAQAEAVRALLPATMRNAMSALFPQVPIEVEANICRHWGDKA